MKIWAKTIKDEKITRDILYNANDIESLEDLTNALHEICDTIDIPTPVITSVNIRHFLEFNNTRFKPRDFIESVDFDLFDIEAVPDKKN